MAFETRSKPAHLYTSFGIEIDQRIVVAKTRINSMINPTPDEENSWQTKRRKSVFPMQYWVLACFDPQAMWWVTGFAQPTLRFGLQLLRRLRREVSQNA